MEIRRILLALTADGDCASAIRLAARVAREHGATVEGLCLFQEPDVEIADSFALGSRAVGEVLDHRKSKIDAITAKAQTAFRSALTDRGLSEGWITGEIDEWIDEAISRARLADLVIFGEGGRGGGARRLLELLTLRSGTPCLVCPAGAPEPFDRVVLAWNGSAQAKRAMADGIDFLKRADAVAVMVAGEEATRRFAQAHIERLLNLLARHGVQAELIRIEGGARDMATSLLDGCRDFGAKLLIMGAFGHSRASETILGGVTRSVLARPLLPTLLSR